MVIATGEAIGSQVGEEVKLSLFLSDWSQQFPLVFSGLAANCLTLVTRCAPELVPSHTSSADSAAGIRVFQDLSWDVDAKLAALHTQVQRWPLPLVEQDKPVDSPTLSAIPAPSSDPSGCSASSCSESTVLPPLLLSVHPAEWDSANKVVLALVLASSTSADSACHCLMHKAAVVAAVSLAVHFCHFDLSYSLTNGPYRSLLALCKLIASTLTRLTRVM